jgi:hypothetical protein
MGKKRPLRSEHNAVRPFFLFLSSLPPTHHWHLNDRPKPETNQDKTRKKNKKMNGIKKKDL